MRERRAYLGRASLRVLEGVLCELDVRVARMHGVYYPAAFTCVFHCVSV